MDFTILYQVDIFKFIEILLFQLPMDICRIIMIINYTEKKYQKYIYVYSRKRAIKENEL